MYDTHPDAIEERNLADYFHGLSYPQHVVNCNHFDWTKQDPKECVCRGSGWFYSSYDSLEKCRAHYDGQLSPEDYDQKCLEEQYRAEHGDSEVPYDEPTEIRAFDGETTRSHPLARAEWQGREVELHEYYAEGMGYFLKWKGSKHRYARHNDKLKLTLMDACLAAIQHGAKIVWTYRYK